MNKEQGTGSGLTLREIQASTSYCLSEILPADWTGTVLDILRHERIPAAVKLDIALFGRRLNARTLRLFAVKCARTALALPGISPDPRSLAACDVTERFANGQATEVELAAASRFARSARAAIRIGASTLPRETVKSAQAAATAASRATHGNATRAARSAARIAVQAVWHVAWAVAESEAYDAADRAAQSAPIPVRATPAATRVALTAARNRTWLAALRTALESARKTVSVTAIEPAIIAQVQALIELIEKKA